MKRAEVEAAARLLNLRGWTCFDGAHEPGEYDQCEQCRAECRSLARSVLTAARTAVPHLLDQLDAAEKRVSEEKTLRMKAAAAATRAEAQADIRGRAVAIYQARAREAEARIGRLENRAVHETIRANEWRDKHRVMAQKRDAAHRAYIEMMRERNDALTRLQEQTGGTT